MTGAAELTIIVDTREQTPLVFPDGVRSVRGTLRTGDYSIAGYESAFTIERKSLGDLVNTVIHDRARFERELGRMTAYEFRRLLIVSPYARVAAGGYRAGRSRVNPRAVIASVAAFEMRYGVPAVFAADEPEAVRRVMDWAHYFVREKSKRQETDGDPVPSPQAPRACACVEAPAAPPDKPSPMCAGVCACA